MIQTTRSEQYGHPRFDFDVPDSPGGFVIEPKAPARGKPWAWYAPTFIREPHPLPKALHEWYMSRLLNSGIAIAGVDVRESWGNSAGRAVFTQFHALLVRERGMDSKACLIGQSRGGLMQYNWAVENPGKVRCIVGIYPVCDVFLRAFSAVIASAYGLTPAQLAERRNEHNPVDRVASLAAAQVPIFHIHGDVDEVVPLESNSEALVGNYRSLGGPAELIVIKGKGHAEIPEFFQCPALVEFIRKQGLGE
jgi:dipeptidyl aminopeptidase/acylaminoacyl peptidase